jgi:uncharacterized membrane protein YbhN (UPF0104 family)
MSIVGVLVAVLPVSDLWQTIRQVPLWLWTLAVMSLILGHVVGAMKWRILIGEEDRRLSISDAFRCYFAGLFANLFLPSMTGGDIVRAGLAIRLNKNKETVILGSLLDRIVDMSTLLGIVLSGSLLVSRTYLTDAYGIVLLTPLLIVLLVLGCVIAVLVPLRYGRPRFLVNSARRFHLSFGELIRRPSRVLLALSASIVIQMWFILISYVLARRVGISFSLTAWLIVWPLSKLSAMLPISIGGVGVREVALAGLLRPFGVAAASAVGLGLLWESLIVALGGFGGIFYLLSRNGLSRPGVAVT